MIWEREGWVGLGPAEAQLLPAEGWPWTMDTELSAGPGCDLLGGCSSSCLCHHHPPCQRLFKCYLKDLPLLPWGSEAEGLAPLTMGLQPGGLTQGLSQTPSRDSGSLG